MLASTTYLEEQDFTFACLSIISLLLSGQPNFTKLWPGLFRTMQFCPSSFKTNFWKAVLSALKRQIYRISTTQPLTRCVCLLEEQVLFSSLTSCSFPFVSLFCAPRRLSGVLYPVFGPHSRPPGMLKGAGMEGLSRLSAVKGATKPSCSALFISKHWGPSFLVSRAL